MGLGADSFLDPQELSPFEGTQLKDALEVVRTVQTLLGQRYRFGGSRSLLVERQSGARALGQQLEAGVALVRFACPVVFEFEGDKPKAVEAPEPVTA